METPPSLEILQDIERSKLYLQTALDQAGESGESTAFFQRLMILIDARGGMQKLADEVEISLETLQQAFSEKQKQHFETIIADLNALSFKLSLEVL